MRKRLATVVDSTSSQSNNYKFLLLPENPALATNSIVRAKSTTLTRRSKIYPFKNYSVEEFRYTKEDSFDRTSSSHDSSDCECDALLKQKNVAFKNEEKSHLLCYKDDTKLITIKNDVKLTKSNALDVKFNEKRGKMIKYKSLDYSEPKMLVKYLDTHSNISISAQEFDSDFKKIKFDRKKDKHDIICDTVDAWSKKNNKSVFSNIKSSLFKSSHSSGKEIIYKPLVFGGTFPIDAPCSDNSVSRCNLSDDRVNNDNNLSPRKKNQFKMPKMREYGPARSFDIDLPI